MHLSTLKGQLSADFSLPHRRGADNGITMTNKEVERDSGYSDEMFSVFSGTPVSSAGV